MSGSDDAPIAHGGALGAAIARFGGEPEDWLDLSTGISPFSFPLPPMAADIWRRLPDPAEAARVAGLARLHYGASVDPVLTPGSQAAIQLLPRLSPSVRTAAILSPTYGEYDLAFRRAGLDVAAVDSIEGLLGADIAVLANPNNPDGHRHDPDTIASLAVGRSGRLTVVDEAFADMHPELSVVAAAGRVPGLLVLRSFGKVFGMAGIRLGFAFGSADILARLVSGLGPWAVSGPALAVAAHAFTRADLVDAQRRRITASHTLTRAAVIRAGLPIVGETALFVLVQHGNAEGLRDRLSARQVLARSFAHSPDVLRIGLVADDAEADRLVLAILAARKGKAQ